MTFDEWMNEVEITGTRYDRLHDTFPLQYTDREQLMEWLRAAYQMGLEHNAAEVERLKEYEWMYKDLCE